MSKSRDTKPNSSDTAELRPEQSPGSASHVSPSPGKVETIDTKGSVRCLIEDSRGRLWMGGRDYTTGLSCLDGSELTTYTQEDGLPCDSISSLLEDDSGRIWIGTTHGLCCFAGEQFIT